MEDRLTVAAVREGVEDFGQFLADPFLFLRATAALASDESTDEETLRDLVIRILDHRSELSAFEPILSSLAGRVGLFPYVDELHIDAADAVAREAHRPLGDADDFVFHSAQAYVYRLLLEGENVILSAPTSFGKSLIIDAVLAARSFANCAVVVPTIALLDETRRRLSGGVYKVITHASQTLGNQNLFVMTQERLLEFPDLPRIDFFAIDEFYKLDLTMDPDRAALLNQAFYRLLKGGGQYYLLGPDVQRLVGATALDARFVHAPFKTVALDIHAVDAADETGALVDLCQSLDEPTIIYCRSPQRTRTVASWLIDSGNQVASREAILAADWVAANYHPDWLVANALRAGIGVHHGRLPRALAHHLVRLFNDGKLRFLVCTSTLIEGVNTAAKNVVIFDNTIARQQLDYFTFNNIRGRSGRMFRHFVGRVFLFHPAPETDLPSVDFPAITQGDTAPTELLIQLDEADLKERSAERLKPYASNPLLPMEVLRSNSGVDLDAQLEVAKLLIDNPVMWSQRLAWTGLPTYEQLEWTCQLIWQLADANAKRTGAFSARQLAWLLNQLNVRRGDVRGLIGGQVARAADADEAIENALAFIRSWPGHNFPKLLMALGRIGESVFPRFGRRSGDYRFYASRVEHLFLPQFAAALEEYGIPAQVSMRISGLLREASGLDEVLERVRVFDVEGSSLGPFERGLIRDTQASL